VSIRSHASAPKLLDGFQLNLTLGSTNLLASNQMEGQFEAFKSHKEIWDR